MLQTVVIRVQFFRAAKIFVGNSVWKWVPATLPLCKKSSFKGDTACGRMLVAFAPVQESSMYCEFIRMTWCVFTAVLWTHDNDVTRVRTCCVNSYTWHDARAHSLCELVLVTWRACAPVCVCVQERQLKYDEYRELASKLMLWLREATNDMQDRAFPSTLIEMKVRTPPFARPPSPLRRHVTWHNVM